MKAAYELKVKQYQKRLGLTHKELNRLDRKHNDINLIKKLQLLYSRVSAKTGFYGTFFVSNEPSTGSDERYMDAYLAYNNVPLTPTQRINSNENATFNVAEADRLPLTSSTLQLIIAFQSGTESVDIGSAAGFETTGNTANPFDEENTISLLVNANNYNNGECSATFLVTYVQ